MLSTARIPRIDLKWLGTWDPCERPLSNTLIGQLPPASKANLPMMVNFFQDWLLLRPSADGNHNVKKLLPHQDRGTWIWSINVRKKKKKSAERGGDGSKWPSRPKPKSFQLSQHHRGLLWWMSLRRKWPHLESMPSKHRNAISTSCFYIFQSYQI